MSTQIHEIKTAGLPKNWQVIGFGCNKLSQPRKVDWLANVDANGIGGACTGGDRTRLVAVNAASPTARHTIGKLECCAHIKWLTGKEKKLENHGLREGWRYGGDKCHEHIASIERIATDCAWMHSNVEWHYGDGTNGGYPFAVKIGSPAEAYFFPQEKKSHKQRHSHEDRLRAMIEVYKTLRPTATITSPEFMASCAKEADMLLDALAESEVVK